MLIFLHPKNMYLFALFSLIHSMFNAYTITFSEYMYIVQCTRSICTIQKNSSYLNLPFAKQV